MPRKEVLWGAAIIFVLLVIVQIIVRAKRPVRSAIGNVAVGWLTLLAVNLTGSFTGVVLPLSALSIGVAGAAGIPGVTMLLLLNLIFM